MAERIWFVIAAAGRATRFGGPVPKPYLRIAGRTLLEHALRTLGSVKGIAGGVVVLANGDRRFERLPLAVRRRVAAVAGGPTRAASVLHGLQALVTADASDWVLVHDAARPCLRRRDVEALIAACRRDPVGGLLAVPVADTLKQADDRGRCQRTLPRERVWRAQTPQMFRRGRLLGRLDAGAGGRVRAGRRSSRDREAGRHAAAGRRFAAEREGDPARRPRFRRGRPAHGQEARVRIGFGYDVHRFGPGDSVRIGGVAIAHTQGVVAHSDGDVLLHALMDALLGAAALGDIGLLFPPGDARYAGADSRALLREVAARVTARGFAVENCDLTLVAEAPRIGPHRDAICAAVAADLGIARDRVNLKATTAEGLGAIGRGEGLAGHAVVLLRDAHGG